MARIDNVVVVMALLQSRQTVVLEGSDPEVAFHMMVTDVRAIAVSRRMIPCL